MTTGSSVPLVGEAIDDMASLVPILPSVTAAFYDQVFHDPLLSAFFTDNDAHHAQRLALYLAQRFGGGDAYDRSRGGLPRLIAVHRGWRFSDAQRDRWVA